MKLALVHDDLIQFGGAERLLIALHEIWPSAPIYTSVISKKWKYICKQKGINVHTSFMQNLPFSQRLNRYYAPFMLHPVAFESFDFSKFDVVLSVSARFSHAVITKPQTAHICYMNSPGRMFWEPFSYFEHEKIGRFSKLLEYPLTRLRMWDYTAAQKVDYFIANSKTPQNRILKYYNRESAIIYPFADIKKINKLAEQKNIYRNDYYLIISRLVPWKKVDIAIEACANLNLPLMIIGDGPDLNRLKNLAKNKKNIKLLGYVSEEEKIEHILKSKAVINTQYEDFGIVPLEAMACGKPVIAFGKGGVLETVVPEKTGIFFNKQTWESLASAIQKFEQHNFLQSECKRQANKFSKEIFQRNVKEFVNSV